MRRFLLLSILLSVPASAAETIFYAYDARGRLVSVGRSGTVNDGIQAHYSYDKADNRANVTVGTHLILYAGQSLWSADGRFHLDMQTDGNLVLYGPSGPMWWTSTNGGSDRRMVMQVDGNLVVYNGANQPLWGSWTHGNPGARLALQNDGNLVIYSIANAAIWATNTVYTPPSFAISDVSVTEGGNLSFTVTKTGATSASFTVYFATANGSATGGSDYYAGTGSVTFAAADATKTITIGTIDDTSIEGAENLYVNLTGASGEATITDSQGVGTINDNDSYAPPSFAISDAYSRSFSSDGVQASLPCDQPAIGGCLSKWP